jgi:hypothetical protein
MILAQVRLMFHEMKHLPRHFQKFKQETLMDKKYYCNETTGKKVKGGEVSVRGGGRGLIF